LLANALLAEHVDPFHLAFDLSDHGANARLVLVGLEVLPAR
jgi:hypothetical protein